MPVFVQCNGFPLSGEEVAGLWRETATLRQCPDELVTVCCVTEGEIKRLNKQYRGVDTATNVLTFLYPPSPKLQEGKSQHDIALCLAVAKREALGRNVSLRDYVAWLLVHAFLHVTGMDHKGTGKEANRMEKLEKVILKKKGFLA